MPSPEKSILEIAKSRILELVLSLMAIIVSIVTPHFDPTFLDKIFPGMKELDYKKVSLTLLLYLVLLSAYVFILLLQQKDKPNFKNYRFDSFNGSWKHKIKEEWICASCKIDNTLSPLAFTEERKMICPKCGKLANNSHAETMHDLARLKYSTYTLEDFAKEKVEEIGKDT